MCYFVTVGVPEARREAVEDLAKGREGFAVHVVRNRFLIEQFAPGNVLFYVTHGGCSCDLVAEPTGISDAEEEARQRERYRRKGWSEAKIARALESRGEKKRHARPDDPRPRFVDAIRQWVVSIGQVRLLAHSYSGSVDDEQLERFGQTTVTLAEFLRDEGTFPADTLVDIVRGEGGEAAGASR